MTPEEMRTFADVLAVFGPPAILAPLSLARRPVVYVVVALNAARTVEYVGSSGSGLDRPFNPQHEVLRRCVDPAALAVWPMPSVADARLVEDALMARLAPRLNRYYTPRARALLGP